MSDRVVWESEASAIGWMPQALVDGEWQDFLEAPTGTKYSAVMIARYQSTGRDGIEEPKRMRVVERITDV